jgi:hypothetical protein
MRDVVSEGYYEPIGISGRAGAVGTDKELARRFWDWTEKELEGQSL